jgi:proteasome lid subunit RPN8/RPN11
MKREVCFLIGPGGEVLWSDSSESAFALPDSRVRWDAIWANRERLAVIAHSHPEGPLAFSEEDATTMEAIDTALGRPVRYAVVAPSGMVVRDAEGARLESVEPKWAEALREASGMK